MIRFLIVLTCLTFCTTAGARKHAKKLDVAAEPTNAASSSTAVVAGEHAASGSSSPALGAAQSPTSNAEATKPTAAAPVPSSIPAPAPKDTLVDLQSRPRGKLTKEEIQGTLAEASKRFQAGQHVEAAEMLLIVYESDPRPILLFNAGQAFRRAARPKEARSAYQRFVAADPEHALVPEVRGYIKDMETLEAVQQSNQQISIELQQEKVLATSAQRALENERHKPMYKRAWFWSVIGGITIAAGVGLGVGLFVRDRTQADEQVRIP